MQKQEQNLVECNICGNSMPQTNYEIHKVRCGLRQEQSQIKPSSRLSTLRMNARRSKVFEQKKAEIIQEDEEKIPCPFCGYLQSLAQLDSHPNKCAGKQDVCQYCGDSYPSELMEEHEDVCEHNEHSQQQQESIQIQNPLQRLMRLLELVNSLHVMLGNAEQEQGLPQQTYDKLKKFVYKPGNEDQLCTICYCKFQKGQQCLELRCRHLYHTDCIKQWFQKSSKCPVCKHDQNQEK